MSRTTATTRTVSVNDLDMHILECRTPESTSQSPPPLVLLLHGFPELSHSWRKVIQPIADAGYHVVAPDQRGFGRTITTTSAQRRQRRVQYADDLAPFRMLNLVNDIISLVRALGHTSVFAIVGHDFGSPVAGYCAFTRPDIFRSLVLMSAPFTGPPPPPPPPPSPNNPSTHPTLILAAQLSMGLAALDPPRKHYTQYFSSPDANADMSDPPGGLHAFLRAYFHVKSADAHQTQTQTQTHTSPLPLPALTPTALATLPNYYVMPLHATMPQAIAPNVPSSHPDDSLACSESSWLPDSDLEVYVSEYARTGFQGGLNWYRCLTNPTSLIELSALFSPSPSPSSSSSSSSPPPPRLTVPTMFIAGKEDWGVYQFPGAAELMRDVLCARTMDLEDFVIVDKAGHWVQQEAPEAVVEHLLRFFAKVAGAVV